MSLSVRLEVVNTLLAIQDGQSLSQLLDALLLKIEKNRPEDKGFAHALLLSTLRHWFAQSRLIDTLADKPIDEKEVRTVLHIGLTQLLYLNVADYAAIHETVEVIKQLGLGRASGLVNAILRKVNKNPNKYRKKCDKNHSLPNWLAKQLKQDWSDNYDELTKNLRQPAPIFLRADQISSQEYLSLLQSEHIQANILSLITAINSPRTSKHDDKTKHQFTVNPIALVDTVSITALPQFQQGGVSVQDAHAQLAAPIIQQAIELLISPSGSDTTDVNTSRTNTSEPKTLRFLDACAAPGGKLAHWLSLLNQQTTQTQTTPNNHTNAYQMLAIDNDISRIERMKQNLKRTHQYNPNLQNYPNLQILCADATTWKDDTIKTAQQHQSFDAILLDAPCTATGVIRRHPDISLLRQENDVKQTVQLQANILDNLWQQLKPNGVLLYITCSILKAENEEQMQDFIKRHDDVDVIAFCDEVCNWGIAQQIGRQCLPLADGGDGFYFALLQKQA